MNVKKDSLMWANFFPYSTYILWCTAIASAICGSGFAQEGRVVFRRSFDVGEDPVVIFEKTLPNGRVATVKNRIWVETRDGQDAEFQHGVMTVRDDDEDTETVVWEKKGRIWRGWALTQPKLEIHDVAEKEGRTAIIYTAGGTHVEILQCDGEGGREVVFQKELYSASSNWVTESAEFAWLDRIRYSDSEGKLPPLPLYVVALRLGYVHLWCIDIRSGSAERLYPVRREP